MRGKLSFTSETTETSHTHEMSSPSFILPDSPPPQHVLNYWQRKAAESCAGSSAAAAAAAASAPASAAPAPAPQRPTSPGGEMVIPDSPIQRLRPAPTWAPRRAVLTTLSNNIRQRQAKRKLAFEEGEVSGEEEDEVLPQSKKRVVDEDSSLVPLIKEAELDFVQLVNKPLPKPWVPLRELEEDQPYRIVAAREHTNQHGRRIILKIINAGSKCEVYLPQRFASCIDAGKIRHFNETCIRGPDAGQTQNGPVDWIPCIAAGKTNNIYVRLRIEGETRTLLVDTGAEISILKYPIEGMDLSKEHSRSRGVTGAMLGVFGIKYFNCRIAHLNFVHPFSKAEIAIQADGILGADFLDRVEAVIDVTEKRRDITEISSLCRREKKTNNVLWSRTRRR
ncbi:uncharacterized protein LOC111057681 [Nilaparvata lugens]|uniref:uncharacterized protein LOC111057681 n=1 Tax=Nilaparvata lugens TaxID=108931 RepID=UPI00193CAD2C|nr:uncharacterized protein LOC111057681 [Nilaparvata lugens]